MDGLCSLRELHTQYKKEIAIYKSKLNLCITDTCQHRLTYLRRGNWVTHLVLGLLWLHLFAVLIYYAPGYQYRICATLLSALLGYALLVSLPRFMHRRLRAEFSGPAYATTTTLDHVGYGEWDLLRIVLLPVHFVGALRLQPIDVSNGLDDFMKTHTARTKEYARTMTWQAVAYCITLGVTDLCLNRVIVAHLAKQQRRRRTPVEGDCRQTTVSS